MQRRNFVAGALATGAGLSSQAVASASESHQFIELREYTPLNFATRGVLMNFLKDAAIPAWNRMGITPVGVFQVKYGPSSPSVYVLLPHNSIETALNSSRMLLDDEQFMNDGSAFVNASISNPGFVRYESSLMLGFSHMPTVEIPEIIAGKNGRIFEFRVYESHSEKAAKKKIEMFNEGGEIAIFRDTGLHPVFFGETVIGPRMPNLTYMLGFESMAQRDENWSTFVNSPAWKELSGKSEYDDTVSNIFDYIMTPTGFSQI